MTSRLGQRFARVWPFFAQSRSGWALAIVATIVASATEPMVPALLKPLLDQGFQNTGFPLWQVPVFLVLLFGARSLAGFVAQYALASVTNTGLQNLRRALFGKLLSAELTLFKDQSASEMANTVVYEVQTGSQMLINAVMRLARDLLSLLALVAYLLYLNWKLTLVVAVMFPAVAWVVRSLSKRLYSLTKQSQVATDGLAYVVEENVLAHRDIRLHGAQQGQADRFDVLSESLRRLSIKSTAAHAGMSAITQMLTALALATVISIALVQSHQDGTTVGGFVAFVTAMLMLVAPLKGLSDSATPITRGLAALERGLDLMDQRPDEKGGGFAKPRAAGQIVFSGISLRYGEQGRAALDDIDLQIEAGQTVALVGASGAGKTTLVNLLPRFVNPSAGSISLDGVDLRNWSLDALRAQFAAVSQHVVLLNDTMAANVALGKAIDQDRVRRCLEDANLGALLAELPEGLDTLLGHNAMQMSGGQRQRLAIARALYKDAPILILDEATSALDGESEQAVQQALARLKANRTSLIIAHRLSTIQHVDRIVVMDAGRIIESGTHEALLAQGGAYRHLYQLGFPQEPAGTQASET